MAKRIYFDYCRAMTRNAGIQIIRKHELAKMLNVSPSTIYRMIANGSLPPPLRTEKGYIQGTWTSSSMEKMIPIHIHHFKSRGLTALWLSPEMNSMHWFEDKTHLYVPLFFHSKPYSIGLRGRNMGKLSQAIYFVCPRLHATNQRSSLHIISIKMNNSLYFIKRRGLKKRSLNRGLSSWIFLGVIIQKPQ